MKKCALNVYSKHILCTLITIPLHFWRIRPSTQTEPPVRFSQAPGGGLPSAPALSLPPESLQRILPLPGKRGHNLQSGFRRWTSGVQTIILPAHIRPTEAVKLFAKWNRTKIDCSMLHTLGIQEMEKKQYGIWYKGKLRNRPEEPLRNLLEGDR